MELKDNIIKQIADKIKLMVKSHNEIIEVYLFGSIVRGGFNNCSDIDIAVLTDDNKINGDKYTFGYKSELISELMGILKMNKVDMVLLNQAGILLYHRIVTQGKCIFTRNLKETRRKEYRVIQKYLDFKPMINKMNKELYNRIENKEFGTLKNA